MDKSNFFLITAAIAAAGSLFILLFFRLLKPTLERRLRTGLQPGPDMATEMAAAS